MRISVVPDCNANVWSWFGRFFLSDMSVPMQKKKVHHDDVIKEHREPQSK